MSVRCLAAKGKEELLDWKRARGFLETMLEVIKTRSTQTMGGTCPLFLLASHCQRPFPL